MIRRAKGWLIATACMLLAAIPTQAQNRGVYPLGMTATNSGITPPAGFTYSNQLLYYSRSQAKDDLGNTAATGENGVIMDMNTLTWASKDAFLWSARYSAAATLPFAKNDLTSDIHGNLSGGGGFADSYFMPFILGWSGERAAIRVIYGFLAPTGRFAAGATNNVGSGYWSHAVSSGQTFYLIKNALLTFSTFEMYEVHTTQEGTRVHPGQTFDLDYSLMTSLMRTAKVQLQIGVAGYETRQTTATTGPEITASAQQNRYAVNSLGFAINAAFPRRKASLGMKYFKEFANHSTFQGYSLQFTGAISF
jgi:hypothetical protein